MLFRIIRGIGINDDKMSPSALYRLVRSKIARSELTCFHSEAHGIAYCFVLLHPNPPDPHSPGAAPLLKRHRQG